FLSFIAAVVASRFMSRYGPDKLIPLTFLTSALLNLCEWGGLQVEPAVVAVVLYLHMGVFGGILVSGFWSMVNERFDPHTAKKHMGRMAGGAALGGLVGGLTAERVAALVGIEAMFPILAGLHFFCAWRVLKLRLGHHEPAPKGPETQSGFQLLATHPYLRQLAIMLALTTVMGILLEFVFKSEAAAEFQGDALLQFFAIFYTAASTLAFLIQTFVAGRVLQRLGLARTASVMPVGVVVVGGVALITPGLWVTTAMIGVQEICRNSFFRSAYELLYTPIPRFQKRAVKLIIDVGVDRVGDAIGAGIVAVFILADPAIAYSLLIGTALALAAAASVMAFKIHAGYVSELETSLVAQAEGLDLKDDLDAATRTALHHTMGSFDVAAALIQQRRARPTRTAPPVSAAASSVGNDPLSMQIASLRSRETARVVTTLAKADLQVATAAHIIALVAWDDVKPQAMAALRRMAPQITGQLIDALLNPDEEFAIRRRVPRALRHGIRSRASAGLLTGLDDPRFEVRFQCALALHWMAEHDATSLSLDPGLIYAHVIRELAVGERVWTGHRLLDDVDASDQVLIDDLLQGRANRGLEHVFTLLALVLPPKPVRVAFRGLHTADQKLRGTALEYIDSALPETVAEGIRAVVQGGLAGVAPTQGGAKRPTAELAGILMESMSSIELDLQALRELSKLKSP
ncbi:MAG: AAA family ATP:ADP antiporter, partial [Myxococcota bacterium]